MTNYLLEVSLCWLGFYLLYAFWLSKETFFQINRWYLIVTLLLGLSIPFAEWPTTHKMEEEQLTYLETVTITVSQVEAQIATVVASPISERIVVQEILLWVYGLGVLLMSIRFFYGLLQIYRHYRSSNLVKKKGYVLLENKAIHLPFSFFNYLFISASAKYTQKELDSITRHELVHIKEHHSVDVILLEVLTILFWCSPLIYGYRRSIRNVHEYLADEKVLQKTTKKQYGQLLLQQFEQGRSIAMANNFIHSQLKKRIQMMTKNQSTNTARWKYLLVIPVFLCLLLVLSKTELIAQMKNPETVEQNEKAVSNLIEEKQGDPIFTVVEEMPRFPGCEDVENKEERKKCSQQKMLEFVYSSIKYPSAARKNGTEGITVVRFVVNKNGKVQKAEMLRTIGGGCDEEVLRVVNEMPTWIPGKQRGAKVDVYFNLPVKFKLEGGEEASTEKVEKEESPNTINVVGMGAPKSQEEIFTVVEEMPRFPGCEDVADMEERKNCSRQKMLEFIYRNVKYPKEAQDAGTEGMVVVRFTINKKGEVMNPEILRSRGDGLDEAVLDVVEKMNGMEEQWIPGKQRGKLVNVYYNLPVKFKLDPAAASEKKEEVKSEEQTLVIESFEMSPNPARNEVRLSFEIADAKDLKISITDVNGKIVALPVTKFTNGRNDLTLDLSKVAPGILFVVLENGEKVFSKQLVKQ